MINQILNIIIRLIKGSTDTKIKKTTKKVDNLRKSVDKSGDSAKKSRGAMIGFGMSLLFTGMALKRFATTTLSSFFNAAKLMGSQMTTFNVKTEELIATWSFFKFVMADTLGQSKGFVAIVDFLVNIINMVSEFISKHPALAEFITMFLLMAVSIGTVSMVMGQLHLLAVGLGIGLLPLIGIILLISASVAALFVLWSSDFSDMTKMVLTLAIVLGTVMIVMALLGKTTSMVFIYMGNALTFLTMHPLGRFILALGLVILTLWNMQEAMGGFGNFFKSVFIGIQKIALLFSNFLVDKIISKVEGILKFAEAAARFVGKDAFANQISGQITKLTNFKNQFAKATGDAIMGVDIPTAAIRAENPAVENLAKLMLGVKEGPAGLGDVDSLIGERDTEISKAEEQSKKMDALSGGASLADLEVLQEQANVKLEALEESKVELEKQNGSLEDIKALLQQLVDGGKLTPTS